MKDSNVANAAPEMALIPTAGSRSQLRPQTKIPKPLTKVLGLSLAERVVCAFGRPTASLAAARAVVPATKGLRTYISRP